MKRPLAALAATLTLAACGPSVTAGEVVTRQYEAPWVQHGSTCISYNQSGFCQVSMPTTTNHPERFLLRLRANIDGKWHEDWVAVSEHDYETCRVGWHYPACEPR